MQKNKVVVVVVVYCHVLPSLNKVATTTATATITKYKNPLYFILLWSAKKITQPQQITMHGYYK